MSKVLQPFLDPLFHQRMQPRLEFLALRLVPEDLRGDALALRRIGEWLDTVPDASRVAGAVTGRGVKIAIIPLLFETRWDADYDIICCVRSGRDLQISRMMTTRGYTRAEAEARLAAQMPVEEKAAKSHYVIDNNGTSEELKSKVKAFVVWLKTPYPQRPRCVAR